MRPFRSAFLLALALVAASAASRAEETKPLIAPSQMTSYWWTFLVSGDNKTPVTKEENAEMFKGHIANLERMWKEGKSVAAGPFGDAGPLRGIVVLTVKTREEALAEFKNDPFVKARYMKPEIYQWRTLKNSFGKAEEPIKMGKYRFVLYKKGPGFATEATAEQRNEHLKYVLQARKEGVLSLAGPLVDAGDNTGILAFRSDDEAAAKAFVAADPYVRSGRFVPEHHLLYIAKGVLDAPK